MEWLSRCSKGHLSQWLCLQEDLVHVLYFPPRIWTKGKGVIVIPICREEYALCNLILTHTDLQGLTVLLYGKEHVAGSCPQPVPAICSIFLLDNFKERMKHAYTHRRAYEHFYINRKITTSVFLCLQYLSFRAISVLFIPICNILEP